MMLRDVYKGKDCGRSSGDALVRMLDVMELARQGNCGQIPRTKG